MHSPFKDTTDISTFVYSLSPITFTMLLDLIHAKELNLLKNFPPENFLHPKFLNIINTF